MITKITRCVLLQLLPVFIGCPLLLVSCAAQVDPPFVWDAGLNAYDATMTIDPKVYDQLMTKVSEGRQEIKRSLPELKYARSSKPVVTIPLRSPDGQVFQALVLKSLGPVPGKDFMLVYLMSPKGDVVDWKSRWLDTGSLRALEVRVFDVNDDGVKEFCFVCKPSDGPAQLLSAFRVKGGRFEAAIAEEISYFTVEFEETVLESGIVIQPQLKGPRHWERDKLYEVPLRIINRATEPKSLRGCYVSLSADADTMSYSSMFAKKDLDPGDSLETTMTVKFSQDWPDLKVGFDIEKYDNDP